MLHVTWLTSGRIQQFSEFNGHLQYEHGQVRLGSFMILKYDSCTIVIIYFAYNIKEIWNFI
jgi:hypothetical protein